ncbi:MAG: hypothetical protein ACTHX5_15030 [Brevibacterium aurantiacum]
MPHAVRRLLAGALATLVAATGLIFAGSSAAMAADRIAGTPTWTTFMGIEKEDGVRFICMDNGRAVPTTMDTPTKTVNAPDLAYLFWKYGETTDDVTATALAYIVKTHTALPHNHKGSTPTLQQDKVAELRKEAKDRKGPYRASVEVAAAKDDLSASVTNLGVRSSAGNWMSGHNMTATITGPGVWKGTDSKTLKIKTGSKGLTQEITRTGAFDGDDTIKVDITVEGLPTSTIRYQEAETPNHQRVVRLDQPVGDVKAADSDVLDRVKLEYEISTRAQHEQADDEGVRSSTDEIEVRVVEGNWPKDAKLTVKSTLWSNGTEKPELQDGVPENATKIGETETVFTGPGVKTTESITVPTGMGRDWFVWTEQVEASGSGASAIHAWDSQYGIVAETFTDALPEEPFSPKVETQTGQLDENGDISDSFRVFLEDGQEWGRYTDIETSRATATPVTVTFDLYHSMTDATADRGAEVPEHATHLGQVKSDPITEPIDDLTAPAVNVEEKYRNGSLTWVATIDPNDTPADQGRENVEMFVSEYGIDEESVFNQWTPQVVTQAQSPVIDAGDDMIDILTVTGMPDDNGSTVEAKCLAWGPFETQPEVGTEVTEDAALAGEGSVEVTGDGEYECNAGPAPEPGHYVFTSETLESDDGRVDSSEDRKVYAEESFTVRWEPHVWTNAQEQEVVLDENGTARISDVLTMTGGQPNTSVPVTVYLNGPIDQLPEDLPEQPKAPAETPDETTAPEGAAPEEDAEADAPAESEESGDTNVAGTAPAEEPADDSGEKSEEEGTVGDEERPFADPASAEEDFDTSQVLDQVDIVLELDENGEATVVSPEFEVNAVNYYWFTYKSDGTDYVNPFGDDNIYKEEAVFVSAPDVLEKPDTPEGPRINTGGAVVASPGDGGTASHLGLAAGAGLLLTAGGVALAAIRRPVTARQ